MTGPALWTYLISPVVVAGLLLALLRYAGNTLVGRWLNRDLEEFKSQQQEKVEALKAEQARELEHLRHLLSSRVSKIHEKEFEILPVAWLMLHELNGAVALAVQVTMQFLPGFDFSSAKLEHFLRNEIAIKRLAEYQADELRTTATGKERLALYKQFTQSKNIDDASEKQRLFSNYLIQNRIFMSDELRSAFEDAHTVLRSALIGFAIGSHGNDIGSSDKNWDMIREAQREMTDTKMQERLDRVEREIKKRLRYAEAD